jgi:ABC-type multidrug transport system permease subunit
MLLVVLLVYAGLVAFLGILLGSLARTEGQAVGIGVLASNVLAALGGCWWPIEVTPEWMQRLALFLPTGWAMDALHKLVNFGAPAASALPHVLVMLAASVVAAALSARVFRFQ